MSSVPSPPLPEGTPLAKGTAFLHDHEYIERTYGPEAWANVLSRLSPEDRETYASMVAIGWYENALLVRIFIAIEAALAPRDPAILETLGRYAAEQDLTRIHRILLRMANPALVLEKATGIWHRFFDTGTWHVERIENGANAILGGAGVTHEMMCKNLRAYIQRLFELVGAKGVTVTHVKCKTRGDEHCEYAVRWA
jgi:hypothetical protein